MAYSEVTKPSSPSYTEISRPDVGADKTFEWSDGNEFEWSDGNIFLWGVEGTFYDEVAKPSSPSYTLISKPTL